MKSAFKSFFSGHASYSSCGCYIVVVFLISFYLINGSLSGCETRWGSRKTEIYQLILVGIWILLNLAMSLFTAYSRVIDFRHFASDVITGHLVGLGCVLVSYFIFRDGWLNRGESY